ncbi:23S rRNA (adenine(2503)-C(2))-methyltransferase RlmN [candidate division KSB1 bacterium]
MTKRPPDRKSFILDYTPQELELFLSGIGEAGYRARQIYHWIYKKFSQNYNDMTDLPALLQRRLIEISDISRLTVESDLSSEDNEARKFLFRLDDGNKIESVYMVNGKRRTICISSQAGCALKCSFCATGLMGLKRHLTAGEMVDQVVTISRITGSKPTNIVFMGMGEPFHNYENTLKAAQILNSSDGINIGARHITLSTVGLSDKIERFYKEGHRFKLAVSINAGTEETRRKIMPISKKFPLKELYRLIRTYHTGKSYPATLEYVLIKGINDTEPEMNAFIEQIKGLPVRVNLIPCNFISKDYAGPDKEQVDELFLKLYNAGIQVNVRWSKGTEIQAACGQLYTASQTDPRSSVPLL